MKLPCLITILGFIFAGCTSTKQTLPPQEPVDRIEISGIDLPGKIEITDTEKIQEVVQFINDHPDGWGVPWYGPPVAAVRLDLWNDDEFVGNLGISRGLITRTYGNFWSRPVSSEKTKQLALSVHQSIYEGAFAIFPDDFDLRQSLKSAESKLKSLGKNKDINEIYEFISREEMTISADYRRFINVTIETLNEGEFADTTITGQFSLNEDRSLKKIRFLGVRIIKKNNSNKAVDTTAANARLFHNETSNSTNPDVVAMTEAAAVSP